jgi:tripartite-type tricarboxylate transporter receptor subunit TctC
MKSNARRGWIKGMAGVIAAGMLAAQGAALAATPYPAKTITIVVPFPPGGSTDLLARRIGEKLAKAFGQPVLVENRPGAGGTVGSDYVAKAPPDGYTLLMGVTGTNAISASLYPKLPYDPLRDFMPVSLVVSSPLVLVVPATSRLNTMGELIAFAKKNPGAVTHGSPGNGTSMHLTGEMFAQASGTQLTHVPYKGSAPALQDLIGGQTMAMFGDLLVVQPQVAAGKLRALAVSSKQRHPMFPEVPTMAESGLADFEALSWQGLFAPSATPPEVVARLSEEVVKAVRSAELKEFFAARGFIVEGRSPADSQKYIQAEVPKWARIVKSSGATAD